MDPKTTPAFPLSRGHFNEAGLMTSTDWMPGLSQYAYVAMTFHGAILAGRRGPLGNWSGREAANDAFNHADAFFAELAKRTKS